MATDDEPAPDLTRIGHAERDAATARLTRAHDLGQLEFRELDERMAAVIRAKTRADLEPLLADLPESTVPARGSGSEGVAATWAHPGRRALLLITMVTMGLAGGLALAGPGVDRFDVPSGAYGPGRGAGFEPGTQVEHHYIPFLWPIWVMAVVGAVLAVVTVVVARRRRGRH